MTQESGEQLALIGIILDQQRFLQFARNTRRPWRRLVELALETEQNQLKVVLHVGQNAYRFARPAGIKLQAQQS